jgi:hypothetical protein
MSLPAPDLIDALGGASAVAHETGAREGAVRMWKARGEIPANYQLVMWKLALRAGVNWQPAGADDLRSLLVSDGQRAA